MASQDRRPQILRHRSPLGEWEAVLGAPDPRLRKHVHGRYTGWVENTAQAIRRREVAKPFVPVILNFAADFGVLSPGNASGGMERFGSFAAGLHDGAALVESRGASNCLQVNLTPLGAYQVFGLSMDSLANRTVDLGAILGAAGRRLVAQLHDAAGWEDRFALLESFLAARIADARPPAPAVAWAMGRLERSRGGVAIGALARDIGCSRRRLIAQFREQVGMTPKTMARVLRFNHAIGLLGAGNGTSWAALAQDCGYYDQAHFNRDFRALAGCTPGDYLGRSLPDGGGMVE
jgi:AraC-like DNA-binding protein